MTGQDEASDVTPDAAQERTTMADDGTTTTPEQAPARRPTTSRRVALGALVLTAVGILGLGMLAASWLAVGVRTMRAAEAADAPACVVAYGAGEQGADLHYELLPPRGVCTWTVDGRTQDVVVAQVPTALAAGAVVAVLAGVAGVTLWVVTQRQR